MGQLSLTVPQQKHSVREVPVLRNSPMGDISLAENSLCSRLQIGILFATKVL